MAEKRYDVAVIGGGIVGVATALALLPSGSRKRPRSLVVLEAEERLAPHQTGHNSGVIHSGLYYKPDSMKARFCREGRARLLRFCDEHEVPYKLSGKLVVATREEERPLLLQLYERGKENGLKGLKRLSPEAMVEHEPHARGLEALLVPEAGVVDYTAVTEAAAAEMVRRGGELRKAARVLRVVREADALVVETTAGPISARFLVGCAGLEADRVARRSGISPPVRIVPFRGDYFELVPERRDLVNALIYPVPDPRFPFLGVHFTRRISGAVEVGPNAVLALKREGYGRFSFSPHDAFEIATFPGLWRFLLPYVGMAVGEVRRALSRDAFASWARTLVPEVGPRDIRRAGCGVRAQAMTPDGKLVDDFQIVEAERMVHVLNAPSPAATAGLKIGEHIAEIVSKRLEE